MPLNRCALQHFRFPSVFREIPKFAYAKQSRTETGIFIMVTIVLRFCFPLNYHNRQNKLIHTPEAGVLLSFVCFRSRINYLRKSSEQRLNVHSM